MLRRLLTSPLTFSPLALGATTLLTAWAFGIQVALSELVGGTLALSGLGTLLAWFSIGGETLNRRALDKGLEVARSVEKRMRTLDRQYDPREFDTAA
jgi:hypothetical protein